MSTALSAGVTGLQAHQRMLDVAGNNIANVNTTAFKSSRINFAELISETFAKASQPTSTIGGTNPQQIGSGVGVSGVTPNMTQGNIVKTGNPLDLAIEGAGYFVLNNGQQNIYTRAGAFTTDLSNNLVDPATGYRVQRMGSVGESDGFQAIGNSDVLIPYNIALPASVTSLISLTGNLSSDSDLATPQTQKIASAVTYTVPNGSAGLTTPMDELDQFSGGSGTGGKLDLTSGESGTITITGYQPDGTAISSAFTVGTDGEATPECVTLGDLVDHLNTVLSGATASLVNGELQILDDSSGYSTTDIKLDYAADGSSSSDLTDPAYFEVLVAGGTEVKNTNINIFDSQGGEHSLSIAFVRNDSDNTWDMLITSISGDIHTLGLDERRISGVSFSADGSFDGCSDTAAFAMTFGHDTSTVQTIDISLGTPGELDGLTGFSGESTAVAKDQDGYESGTLTSISVNKNGVIVGSFTNNIKRDIGTIQVALFQNAAGLESVGGGYYIPSANSGEPVATQGLTGGAGSIHGGSLEKSNADVATEFINLIEAQNGFQANARTISVANDILRELTNLIR